MINCKCCGVDKDTSEFSFQKRNPTRRYTWCNKCRFDPMSNMVAKRKHQNYQYEVDQMRSKAVSMRKLTVAQVQEAKTARANKEKVADIAARLGVSTTVIYSATNGRTYR